MITFNDQSIINLAEIFSANDHTSTTTGGQYSKDCTTLISQKTGYKYAFLTPSCTSSIEIMSQFLFASGLTNVIVPSFTFTTSVIPFIDRGLKVTFCDVDPNTGCISPNELKKVITSRHDAVLCVSYAGYLPHQEEISEICKQNNCMFLQDDAQSIGNIGRNDEGMLPIADFSALSFHYTKNISCGEGGALLFNNSAFFDQVTEIVNKGTNRHLFLKGQVEKYNWTSLGGSHLMSEVTAIVLLSQLSKIDVITEYRRRIWDVYAQVLEDCVRFVHDRERSTNGHIFGVLTRDASDQKLLIKFLKSKGVQAVEHYTDLSASPFSKKASIEKHCSGAREISSRIVRLPIGLHVTENEATRIANFVKVYFE